MIPFRATLDVERAFVLTPHAIGELEKATGVGIGSLIHRVPTGHFAHAEIVETLRLGLIGAGTPAEDAASIVAGFVATKPLVAAFLIAADLLAALYSGPASEQDTTNALD
ncbi:gene transfer agent family protein [Methylopila sp. 73B]|uniref:gene transfer agent family protein n=1 Tax=Methylopila sp. 73B TaxID=1120792 RepID=UPI0003625F00|nr:gene transfer agent family protein [Methylopila sp. 73B]